MKPKVPPTNKRFLQRTLMSTLSNLNKRKYSTSDYAMPGNKRNRSHSTEKQSRSVLTNLKSSSEKDSMPQLSQCKYSANKEKEDFQMKKIDRDMKLKCHNKDNKSGVDLGATNFKSHRSSFLKSDRKTVKSGRDDNNCSTKTKTSKNDTDGDSCSIKGKISISGKDNDRCSIKSSMKRKTSKSDKDCVSSTKRKTAKSDKYYDNCSVKRK